MFSNDDNAEYSSRKNQRRGNLHKKKIFSKSNKKKASKKQYDNPKSNSMIDVYEDTIEYFLAKQHEVKESTLYDINKLNVVLAENAPIYDTVYRVENIDTLDMALQFRKCGLNPLVLNMASDYKPGGGVRSGKKAQEECLFRRTNAFETHSEEWYPLEANDVIYSPEVYIIKDSDYEMLDENDQDVISMIAVPAIRKPHLDKGEYFEADRKLMTAKIESIFKIALIEGHDSLILGALGCGVFHNPPNEVAQIYKLFTNLYGKYFKQIGFAILCVKESDSDNLNTFRKKY